jgi:Rieske Fe-S protein
MASSGAIMEPLIPTPKGPQVIASAIDMENKYSTAKADPKLLLLPPEQRQREILTRSSTFFYWPYDESVSPYYRNVLVRLPDELVPDPGPGPSITHYAGFNTTCVHLRCLVNPGIADSEPRLLCPCHGSQYGLTSAVPVKGPAFDLGLRPLPRIRLSLNASNQIVAEEIDGVPGIGRSQV